MEVLVNSLYEVVTRKEFSIVDLSRAFIDFHRSIQAVPVEETALFQMFLDSRPLEEILRHINVNKILLDVSKLTILLARLKLDRSWKGMFTMNVGYVGDYISPREHVGEGYCFRNKPSSDAHKVLFTSDVPQTPIDFEINLVPMQRIFSKLTTACPGLIHEPKRR